MSVFLEGFKGLQNISVEGTSFRVLLLFEYFPYKFLLFSFSTHTSLLFDLETVIDFFKYRKNYFASKKKEKLF